MKPTLATLLTTLILGFFLAEHAMADDTISWFVIHRPPSMMLDSSGKTITGGATGKQLLLIQSELQNYTHVNVQMNWGRFWNEIKNGKNLCNSTSFKTPEREIVAEFSIPVAFILPVHIILRKDTFESLGKPESLSITDIIQSKKMKCGLIKKRSYSEQIDPLLLRNKQQTGITRYVVDIERLLLMLMHKRFDYTLEYPPAIDYALSNLKPEERTCDLVSVPVNEIAPFQFLYVACSKNDWGKRVINDLNSALKKLRSSSQYRNTMKEVYSGEQLERAMDIYSNHFINSGME